MVGPSALAHRHLHSLEVFFLVMAVMEIGRTLLYEIVFVKISMYRVHRGQHNSHNNTMLQRTFTNCLLFFDLSACDEAFSISNATTAYDTNNLMVSWLLCCCEGDARCWDNSPKRVTAKICHPTARCSPGARVGPPLFFVILPPSQKSRATLTFRSHNKRVRVHCSIVHLIPQKTIESV